MNAVFRDAFPSDAWQEETENVPRGMIMFRLRNSQLRVALCFGLVPGTNQICGIYVLFRAQDDSMNMECSVPDGQMLKGIVATAVKLCGDAPISHDKFLANLHQWYATKVMRTLRSRTSGANAEEKEEEGEEEEEKEAAKEDEEEKKESKKRESEADNAIPAEKKVKKQDEKGQEGEGTEENGEEDEEKCCVCFENDADTLAVPCGHRVVCASCSKQLNKDSNHKTVCVLCREPITHVNYPDNDMKSIALSHTD